MPQNNILTVYPNPFGNSTLISYQLSETGNVQIDVYALTGKKIKTLFNKQQAKGSYELLFDGSGLDAGLVLRKNAKQRKRESLEDSERVIRCNM